MSLLTSAFGRAADLSEKRRKKEKGRWWKEAALTAVATPIGAAISDTIQSAGKSFFAGPDLWETQAGTDIMKGVQYTKKNAARHASETARMLKEGKGSLKTYFYDLTKENNIKVITDGLAGTPQTFQDVQLKAYEKANKEVWEAGAAAAADEWEQLGSTISSRAGSAADIKRNKALGNHYYNQPSLLKWLKRTSSTLGLSSETLEERKTKSLKRIIFGTEAPLVSDEQLGKYLNTSSGKEMKKTLDEFVLGITDASNFEEANNAFLNEEFTKEQREISDNADRTEIALFSSLNKVYENATPTWAAFLKTQGTRDEVAESYAAYGSVDKGMSALSRDFTTYVLKDETLRKRIKLNAKNSMMATKDKNNVSVFDKYRDSLTKTAIAGHSDSSLEDVKSYSALAKLAEDKDEKAIAILTQIDKQVDTQITNIATTQFAADMATALDNTGGSIGLISREDISELAHVYINHQFANNMSSLGSRVVEEARAGVTIPFTGGRKILDKEAQMAYSGYGLTDPKAGAVFLEKKLRNLNGVTAEVKNNLSPEEYERAIVLDSVPLNRQNVGTTSQAGQQGFNAPAYVFSIISGSRDSNESPETIADGSAQALMSHFKQQAISEGSVTPSGEAILSPETKETIQDVYNSVLRGLNPDVISETVNTGTASQVEAPASQTEATSLISTRTPPPLTKIEVIKAEQDKLVAEAPEYFRRRIGNFAKKISNATKTADLEAIKEEQDKLVAEAPKYLEKKISNFATFVGESMLKPYAETLGDLQRNKAFLRDGMFDSKAEAAAIEKDTVEFTKKIGEALTDKAGAVSKSSQELLTELKEFFTPPSSLIDTSSSLLATDADLEAIKAEQDKLRTEAIATNLLPENILAFAKYYIGNALSLKSGDEPIDVGKFDKEQKAVLRKAMNKAVAAGRDYIKYDDYPLLAKIPGDARRWSASEFYRGHRNKTTFLELIKTSMKDPVFEMFSTLGVFNFKKLANGEFEILKDSYNFNKEKSQSMNREEPLDDYSKLVYAGQDMSDSGGEKYTFSYSGKI